MGFVCWEVVRSVMEMVPGCSTLYWVRVMSPVEEEVSPFEIEAVLAASISLFSVF